jgi:ornithine carbamoyltransferase
MSARQLNVARAAGARVAVTADPAAIPGADVIYIDDSSAAGNEQETSAFLHSWIS